MRGLVSWFDQILLITAIPPTGAEYCAKIEQRKPAANPGSSDVRANVSGTDNKAAVPAKGGQLTR